MSSRYYLLWSGINTENKRKYAIRGDISYNKLEKELNAAGFFQVKIQKVHKSISKTPMSNDQIINILQVLLSFLKSGTSFQQALIFLQKHTYNKLNKFFCYAILNELHRGRKLEQAFGSLGMVLPPIFLAIIQVSCKADRLEFGLQNLLNYYEKLKKQSEDIKKLLRYPISVFYTTVVLIAATLFFIVPFFKEMYDLYENNLPELTRWIIMVSETLRKYWFETIGLFIISLLISRYKVLYFLSPLYYLSGIWRAVYFKSVEKIFFAHSMFVMLNSEITLEQALLIVKDNLTVGSQPKITRIIFLLSSGKSFYQSCMQAGWMQKTAEIYFQVAEETGNLKNGFWQAYLFLDNRFDKNFQRISQFLQPLLMCLIGAIILIVLIAIYSPLLQLRTHFYF